MCSWCSGWLSDLSELISETRVSHNEKQQTYAYAFTSPHFYAIIRLQWRCNTGPVVRTCQSDGTWSSSLSCSLATCNPPTLPTGAELVNCSQAVQRQTGKHCSAQCTEGGYTAHCAPHNIYSVFCAQFQLHSRQNSRRRWHLKCSSAFKAACCMHTFA